MSADLLLDSFHTLAEAPNGVQELRELILQLAVQGELVVQDPTDDPAIALLERVKEEKKRLQEEGLLKSLPELKPCDSSSQAHSIPPSWAWANLGDFTIVTMGQSPDSSSYNQSHIGLPFYQGKTDFGAVYPTPRNWCEAPKKMAQAGEILISVRAPVGPTNICPELSCIGRGLTALRVLLDNENFFLLYALRAYEKRIASMGVGSTFVAISKSDLEMFPIPVPPTNEQRRIVAKVDQLMALCYELEKRQEKRHQVSIQLNGSALNKLTTANTPEEFAGDWQRIKQNFDLLYDTPENVAKLKQAILQLAVQGKLISQDPRDEPASVLLDKIKAEKERLIKEKKIKKAEPLPPISDDEMQYKLPKGWVWCRLGDVQLFVNGYAFQSSAYQSSGVGVVRIGDIQDGCIIATGMKYVDNAFLEEIDERFQVKPGDMLIAMSGATTGKIGFNETNDTFLLNQRVGKLELIKVDPDYASFYLNTKIQENLSISSGSAIPNLSTEQINMMVFPLAPEREQQRIVAKVKHLMSVCDELETKLTQTQSAAERLVGAVVRGVLTAGKEPVGV